MNAYAAFGFQFAFIVTLATLLAAVIIVGADRFRRVHSIRLVTLLLIAGGATILAAATRQPGAASYCDGRCEGEEDAAIAEPTRLAVAGMRLFEDLGCIGCHHADGTGPGPALIGLFGRPVTEPACGLQSVDDAYLREAILNPSAIVAAGFAPIMPTFAGRVSQEDLQALVAYLKSRSTPPEVVRQK